MDIINVKIILSINHDFFNKPTFCNIEYPMVIIEHIMKFMPVENEEKTIIYILH
ncbi:hypothetical protein CBE01nite_22800 [Clostridium beijerinckii]|nr:hypothetical protein CBE01nite_22800 [Clostridium beijerinckii]